MYQVGVLDPKGERDVKERLNVESGGSPDSGLRVDLRTGDSRIYVG